MSDSNAQGRHLLKASDFVDVVDEDGNVVGSVPKHWRDEDLTPGTKKKAGRAAKAAKPSGGSESGSDNSGDEVPAKSENRDVLEAYAVTHAGISEEDAKAFGNKDELHAAIVAAKAAPPA